MEAETSMKDFAGSPFLSAKNYKIGEQVVVEVKEYLGFSSFIDSSGEESMPSPIYKVSIGKDEYRFRINRNNTTILLNRGINEWKELVGKSLKMQVATTGKGNSFQIIDLN